MHVKEVKICLLKSHKQNILAKSLVFASRQEVLCTKAEQATVVQAKPKPYVRKSSFNSKYGGAAKFAISGKESVKTVKKNLGEIVFKSPVKSDVPLDSNVPIMLVGKVKVRLCLKQLFLVHMMLMISIMMLVGMFFFFFRVVFLFLPLMGLSRRGSFS